MDHVAGNCPEPLPEPWECTTWCTDCWNREGAILEAALLKWGEAAQAIKAIEELSELQSVLAKWAVHQMVSDAPRYPEGDAVERAVREELADAMIMLEQMELVFGDVSEIEEAKLLRLEEDIKCF